MIDKSIIICVLARDCADALKKNIPKLEELRENFGYSEVIVIENDSIDGTKEILNTWKKDFRKVNILSDNFNFITTPIKSKESPFPGTSIHRIEKMAFYRNQYLHWINANPVKFDLVLVIDIDILDFSINGIIESVSKAPDDWGGLFSNGITSMKMFGKCIHKMYFDMYAYLEQIPDKKPYITYSSMFNSKKLLLDKIQKNRFLPVVSAFGGIGIYKSNAIQDLIYRTEPNYDPYMEAVCEHIPLNIEISKRGFKNYICRDMFVYYGKSEFKIMLRDKLPLKLFNLMCFLFRFRGLKQ